MRPCQSHFIASKLFNLDCVRFLNQTKRRMLLVWPSSRSFVVAFRMLAELEVWRKGKRQKAKQMVLISQVPDSDLWILPSSYQNEVATIVSLRLTVQQSKLLHFLAGIISSKLIMVTKRMTFKQVLKIAMTQHTANVAVHKKVSRSKENNSKRGLSYGLTTVLLWRIEEEEE